MPCAFASSGSSCCRSPWRASSASSSPPRFPDRCGACGTRPRRIVDRRGRLQGAFAESRRADEIGDLARALRELTRRLERHVRALEAFAADLSHELRNPLASIRTASDMAAEVDERGGAAAVSRGRRPRRRPDGADARRRAGHRRDRRASPGGGEHGLRSRRCPPGPDRELPRAARRGALSSGGAPGRRPCPRVRRPARAGVREPARQRRQLQPSGRGSGDLRERMARGRFPSRWRTRGRVFPRRIWAVCSTASSATGRPRGRSATATAAWGCRSPPRSWRVTAARSGRTTGRRGAPRSRCGCPHRDPGDFDGPRAGRGGHHAALRLSCRQAARGDLAHRVARRFAVRRRLLPGGALRQHGPAVRLRRLRDLWLVPVAAGRAEPDGARPFPERRGASGGSPSPRGSL